MPELTQQDKDRGEISTWVVYLKLMLFNHYVPLIKSEGLPWKEGALGRAVYFMIIAALSMAQVAAPTQMGTFPGVLKYLIFL